MFVKIKNNIVTQKQPNNGDGFIEAPDSVVCGMVSNGDGTYKTPPVVNIPVIEISFSDFEGRFTSQEWDAATVYVYQIDITTGKPLRPALTQGLQRVIAQNIVDLSDNKTNGFLGILVSGGVITEDRKLDILKISFEF